MKTLNSFLLLALALTAAPTGRAAQSDGPVSTSLDHARRLALPADASEHRSAVRELTLLSGYHSAFHDPSSAANRSGRQRPFIWESLPFNSLKLDASSGHWFDPQGRAHRLVASNRDFNLALIATPPIRVNPLEPPSISNPSSKEDLAPSHSSDLTLVVDEAAAGFPGEVIEEVIVPVPSEIFAVMDKLGRPDWRAELRKSKTPTFSNRVDVALLLGSVVAEGFVAVQAEDQDAVERIGKDVLRLSESLGLKDTVLPHTNSILEASKNSHWEIVRVELDKTQKTVRDTMEQRRDAELGQCVSLGGWLRGTDAVTSLIMKSYTADAAELLNQPDIIRHFQKELKKLATRNGKLKALLDGLGVIANVIGTGDEAPSAGGVKTIHETADRLVKSITTSASSAQ